MKPHFEKLRHASFMIWQTLDGDKMPDLDTLQSMHNAMVEGIREATNGESVQVPRSFLTLCGDMLEHMTPQVNEKGEFSYQVDQFVVMQFTKAVEVVKKS